MKETRELEKGEFWEKFQLLVVIDSQLRLEAFKASLKISNEELTFRPFAGGFQRRNRQNKQWE